MSERSEGFRQGTHVLDRTSPMGGPFIGRCTLCGAADLPSSAAFEPCPNPRGVTGAEAILGAIEGEEASDER